MKTRKNSSLTSKASPWKLGYAFSNIETGVFKNVCFCGFHSVDALKTAVFRKLEFSKT
jgi:hypothetical protein